MMRRQSARLRRWFRPGVPRNATAHPPLSDHWGFDRGTPIDRYYIERFPRPSSRRHSRPVLEVKDSGTAAASETGSTCTTSWTSTPEPDATIIADLTAADGVPSGSYDCFILTQVLQHVFDTRAVIAHAHRILKPGGVLLVTVPSVSRLDAHNPEYWRFTTLSCRALFGAAFGMDRVEVTSHGNVLTAIGFLAGMAHEELTRRELDLDDERYPLLITVRAAKR
jgi:SAM-dependent methyltransferase